MRVIAHSSAAELPGAERQPDPVSAGAVLARPWARALTPAAVIAARIVIVVAQPEEPDQPYDQEAHVEHAEPDHEDPPLGGHRCRCYRAGSPPWRPNRPF